MEYFDRSPVVQIKALVNHINATTYNMQCGHSKAFNGYTLVWIAESLHSDSKVNKQVVAT